MFGFDDVIFSKLTTSGSKIISSFLSVLAWNNCTSQGPWYYNYYIIRLSNLNYNSEVKSVINNNWNFKQSGAMQKLLFFQTNNVFILEKRHYKTEPASLLKLKKNWKFVFIYF